MSVFAPQVRNLCKSLLEAITYSIAEVFPLPPTCRVFLETLKYIPKYLPRVSVTPPPQPKSPLGNLAPPIRPKPAPF